MDKLELESVYKREGSVQKTAKYFGCSYCKIKYWLINHEIPYELEKNISIIPLEELQEIYSKTKSVRKVGEHFNMSHEKARILLNKHGICNKPIRYECDHTFFSNTNQHSFYWAGFIAADGAIINRNSSSLLSIGIGAKDKSFLEMFKIHLNAENPISDFLIKNSKRSKKWNDTWKSEIKITSEQICTDLKKFNVVPRKSKIYTFPEWLIEHELVDHFMRGYFDGDGSFYIPKPKEGRADQIYFSLRGTKEFLEVFRSILEKNCGLNIRKKDIRVNGGIGVLEYGGNGIVANIAKFLYKDATVYLPRKYELVQHLILSQDI